MKITLIQSNLTWEDAKANRDNFTQKINNIQEQTDLIILPEMFTTGFTMNPAEVAETMDGKTMQWLKQTAATKDCAITGSLVIKEGNKYYNRLVFVLPDGTIYQYDKRHLFSLAGENEKYKAGVDKLIINYRGWKICPLICYDLRFPVFARNTEGYDLLLYVANWPESRIPAWDTLLPARATENMCYVSGVNRTGQDHDENEHPGHSQVVDYLGTVLYKAVNHENVITITLDKDRLEKARKKYGFLNDMDSFNLLT